MEPNDSTSLVDMILRSHRDLARVHDEEIREVQARLREIVAAIQTIRGFGAEIQNTIREVEAVTERQAKLVDAWNGRHQDFLDFFDRQAADFMRQSTDKYIEMLETKAEAFNVEVSRKLKPILDQLAASLQMEVDALGKKVSENSHNAIHDLEAFNSAVRRHTKNWQDQAVKLYGRILVFSILGAFAGTMVALFAVRFV